MPEKDPALASLIGKQAAHVRWSRIRDRSEATAPARQAANDRFEREVDPDLTLDPAERALRADSARKAFFTGLALKSAKARKARRKAEELEAEVERELSEAAGQDGGEAVA